MYVFVISYKKIQKTQSNTYDSNDMGSTNSVVDEEINCALIVLENNCLNEIR